MSSGRIVSCDAKTLSRSLFSEVQRKMRTAYQKLTLREDGDIVNGRGAVVGKVKMRRFPSSGELSSPIWGTPDEVQAFIDSFSL